MPVGLIGRGPSRGATIKRKKTAESSLSNNSTTSKSIKNKTTCRSFSSVVAAAVEQDKALGAKRIGGHVRGQSKLLVPPKDKVEGFDFAQFVTGMHNTLSLKRLKWLFTSALKKAGSVIPTDVISINVSGQIFRTTLCKLNRHPTTLLGNAERRAFFWSDHEQAFIFDRRHLYFQPIFDFYQTGNKIQRPERNIPITCL